MKGMNWMEIRNDRLKGLSYQEIGKKHNVDWRTAKKYCESATKPEYNLKEPKPSKLDPYRAMINVLLEEAPYSAQRIYEKLLEQGFDGKSSIVREYVASLKKEYQEKATVHFETVPGLQGQVDWEFLKTTRFMNKEKPRNCIVF